MSMSVNYTITWDKDSLAAIEEWVKKLDCLLDTLDALDKAKAEAHAEGLSKESTDILTTPLEEKIDKFFDELLGDE